MRAVRSVCCATLAALAVAATSAHAEIVSAPPAGSAPPPAGYGYAPACAPPTLAQQGP